MQSEVVELATHRTSMQCCDHYSATVPVGGTCRSMAPTCTCIVPALHASSGMLLMYGSLNRNSSMPSATSNVLLVSTSPAGALTLSTAPLAQPTSTHVPAGHQAAQVAGALRLVKQIGSKDGGAPLMRKKKTVLSDDTVARRVPSGDTAMAVTAICRAQRVVRPRWTVLLDHSTDALRPTRHMHRAMPESAHVAGHMQLMGERCSTAPAASSGHSLPCTHLVGLEACCQEPAIPAPPQRAHHPILEPSHHAPGPRVDGGGQLHERGGPSVELGGVQLLALPAAAQRKCEAFGVQGRLT
jgi:hypothetical protein